MSDSDSRPILKEVCTQWETQVVGYEFIEPLGVPADPQTLLDSEVKEVVSELSKQEFVPEMLINQELQDTFAVLPPIPVNSQDIVVPIEGMFWLFLALVVGFLIWVVKGN